MSLKSISRRNAKHALDVIGQCLQCHVSLGYGDIDIEGPDLVKAIRRSAKSDELARTQLPVAALYEAIWNSLQPTVKTGAASLTILPVR